MANKKTSRPRANRPTVSDNSIMTPSLESLQNDGQRQILDIVDQLRRHGLDGVVELPQIVVCGDQSAGKSSVLEALTEIPFPRNENLCTRFATEIILRRQPDSSISTRITPDKDRSEKMKEKLKGFSSTISDFSELPEVINKAMEAMGLEKVGKGSRAFSSDVLTIEIGGPRRPHLTLVDTPGLIHSAIRQQSRDDVDLIRRLVLKYIENPRTIILPIITAKNDAANQIILQHCRQMDEHGQRTLGIITKPDTLREGSEIQKDWIDIAMNRQIIFEHGWHMVKNRSDDENDYTFEQRNLDEEEFFSKTAYNKLPSQNKGIEALRVRLSSLLHGHLKKELPRLKDEIDGKLRYTSAVLKQMGVRRSSIQEQRLFLTEISQEINEVVKAATRGQYEHPFFRSVKGVTGGDFTENPPKLRAVIHNLNTTFSQYMKLFGHTYSIAESKTVNTSNAASDVQTDVSLDEVHDFGKGVLHKPIQWTWEEGIRWVSRTLEQSRGMELPGTFNPLIVSEIYWEQSKPWENIALHHIHKVYFTCKNFLKLVLTQIAPQDIRDKLLEWCIGSIFDQSLQAAEKELGRIIEDNNRHPMTYSPNYTTEIGEQRKRKYGDMAIEKAVASSVRYHRDEEGHSKAFINPFCYDVYVHISSFKLTLNRLSAEDALNSQNAIYKTKLDIFVDNVSIQVVERHLVDPLGENLFSPHAILRLTDEKVSLLAAEPLNATRKRDTLEERKKILEMGVKIFKEALNSSTDGL
ncbi:hypothetical protein BS50DRAFT_484185 [Corynespora cassiicola Philippines]|uniref:Dynamin family protein n=1 Tax=Corynespora cassiicola Philippines TaxID=1448308 RepID=A0A2T2P3G1_CORCC|nr:hypothetical protein BS50DRAFT_484185 [Corynespora cassiicola Philippines]